jgi:hypothetical protein
MSVYNIRIKRFYFGNNSRGIDGGPNRPESSSPADFLKFLKEVIVSKG